jgi:hypothetical protein
MAVSALALALEQRAAAARIAVRRRLASLAHRAQVLDHAQGLLAAHGSVRDHRRVRNAGNDDRRELVVGVRAAQHAAPKVDARDQIAVGPMAVRARRVIDAPAVFDVERCGVLRVGRVPEGGRHARQACRHVSLHSHWAPPKARPILPPAARERKSLGPRPVTGSYGARSTRIL